MPDKISPAQRSRNMSRIKGKDTSLEIKVRSFLFNQGFRFRKNVKNLPGKPDIVLPKFHTVIFVNGCFWHHHEGCRLATIPQTRTDFWLSKFNRNIANDLKNKALLEEKGWNVITIWECELKSDYEVSMNRLVSNLKNTVIQKSTLYYFDNIVIPSIEDYLKDVLNVRKAFIASILLYHTIDYLKYDAKKKDSSIYDQVKELIKKDNPNDDKSFALVRDVCNCAKHCHLVKQVNDRIVDDVNSIKPRDHGGSSLFNASFSSSTFNNSGIYVRTRKELSLLPLEPAIRALYKALSAIINIKLKTEEN